MRTSSAATAAAAGSSLENCRSIASAHPDRHSNPPRRRLRSRFFGSCVSSGSRQAAALDLLGKQSRDLLQQVHQRVETRRCWLPTSSVSADSRPSASANRRGHQFPAGSTRSSGSESIKADSMVGHLHWVSGPPGRHFARGDQVIPKSRTCPSAGDSTIGRFEHGLRQASLSHKAARALTRKAGSRSSSGSSCGWTSCQNRSTRPRRAASASRKPAKPSSRTDRLSQQDGNTQIFRAGQADPAPCCGHLSNRAPGPRQPYCRTAVRAYLVPPAPVPQNPSRTPDSRRTAIPRRSAQATASTSSTLMRKVFRKGIWNRPYRFFLPPSVTFVC